MNSNQNIQNQENVVAGICGAFLFSLAGTACYVILSRIGFVSFISGFVGVICAAKGYKIFAKGESVKGMVISIIFAAIAIVIGWYLGWSIDVYEAYQTWYADGEVDFTLTLFESIRAAIYFIIDPDLIFTALGGLALGLVFAVGGGVGYAVNQIKILKAKQKAEEMAAGAPYMDETYNTDYTYTQVDDRKDENSDINSDNNQQL